MSRGTQEKTKLKNAIREALRDETAYKAVLCYAKELELKAEHKAHVNKDWFDSIREHFGKMIDRVDPLEVAAIGGMTYLIQPVVLGSANFTGTVIDAINKAATKFEQSSTQEKVFDIFGGLFGGIGGFLIAQTVGAAVTPTQKQSHAPAAPRITGSNGNLFDLPTTPSPTPEFIQTTPIPTPTKPIIDPIILASWILAFLISFIIIRYGAQILKDLGGINGAIGLLGGLI